MTLDDHPFEMLHLHGNGGKILGRDRAGIEEASAIVKLEVARARRDRRGAPGCVERSQSHVNLPRNRSGRHRFVERVLPQIAHQTAPGTFPVRKKYRRDRDNFAGLRSLAFAEKCDGLRWIQRPSRRTAGKNPPVTLGRTLRIGRRHGTLSTPARSRKKAWAEECGMRSAECNEPRFRDR